MDDRTPTQHCNNLICPLKRKRHTGLCIFFHPSLDLLMFHWFHWSLLPFLALVTFLFGIIAANFFRYKGRKYACCMQLEETLAGSCRNQGEIVSNIQTSVRLLQILPPPRPFLINGRESGSGVEKPLPEPSLSWVQSVASCTAEDKVGPLFPDSILSASELGLRAGRSACGRAAVVNLDV